MNFHQTKKGQLSKISISYQSTPEGVWSSWPKSIRKDDTVIGRGEILQVHGLYHLFIRSKAKALFPCQNSTTWGVKHKQHGMEKLQTWRIMAVEAATTNANFFTHGSLFLLMSKNVFATKSNSRAVPGSLSC